MTVSAPYGSLGVRRRIHAAGALTRLGGAVMAPEVVEAMAAASRASVDIGELQDAASQRIAEATGADLIVMRSHQVDPAEPTQGWGTISHKIAILAQCPVMLMK